MRSVSVSLIAISALAAALAGCNAARAPQSAPQAQAAAPLASSEAPASGGSGCSAAVARYRGIIDNDLAMGHVNKSVHGQISGEIAEAASACSNGQDGRALSLLRASKSRHGYPG